LIVAGRTCTANLSNVNLRLAHNRTMREEGSAMLSWLVGSGAAPEALPARVRDDITRQQDRSEQIISVVQLAIVLTFGSLFLIAPRPTEAALAFDLVPWALIFYLLFTLIRLSVSLRARLPGWFLTLSVVIDMALLMALIWSFHRTYQQPPSFYLKAPTLLYVFIFIALRALRFDARYVLLAGAVAIVGWAVLVYYAIRFAPEHAMVTRNYVEYLTNNAILIGAEFDKILTIALVTLLLAMAVRRARHTLFLAVAEGSAKRELSRFFDAGVAHQITGSTQVVKPGQGVVRQAAVVFLDVRGFTMLSHRLAPGALMTLLSTYQAVVVPIIKRDGGTIDKFLGDGIMATFGATEPSETYAADALRAVAAALAAIDRWNAVRAADGQPVLRVNAAVATGPLVFGAVGDEQRLEYTVIGESVNLAAKLEKHTKDEGVRALTTVQAYELALSQGYVGLAEPIECRKERTVAGVDKPVDIVVLMR
jgi:adenylate cyclase